MINILGVDVVGAAWLVYLLFWFVTAFFTKKAVIKRRWGLQILWRVILIILVITYIRSTGRSGGQNIESLFVSLFNSSLTLQIVGLIMVLLGLVGAVWARIYLGSNWSGYVTYKENHELVTTGPYRFARHPIYTSLLLMGIGTFIYYGYYFILGIFIIMGIIFLWRIKKEEEIMIKLFGQKYKDYMKKTKRLVPGVW